MDYAPPNLQRVKLCETNGDRILMPMVYCLCLTMECSPSTGQHNTNISKLSHNGGQYLAQGHGAVLPKRAGIKSIVQN